MQSQGPVSDLDALLARMPQRLDPETLPALACCWLKTLSASGYARRRWKKLKRLLQRTLDEQLLDGRCLQAIVDIQTCIEQMALLNGQPSGPKPPRSERICATLSSDLLQPYVSQLLNEWLPVEVSRRLVRRDGAVPPLIIGRTLEGLLEGQRLSPRALEMLLQTGLFFPVTFYPARCGDLVRRNAVPTRPDIGFRAVRDACLTDLRGTGFAAPSKLRRAVHHVFLVPQPEGEEVHVPLAPAQALEILNGESVRIGSVIVTMDGRCWGAVRLQMGVPHSVVYRSTRRFRLDYVASQ